MDIFAIVHPERRAGQTHQKKLAQVIEFHTDLTNLTKHAS